MVHFLRMFHLGAQPNGHALTIWAEVIVKLTTTYLL